MADDKKRARDYFQFPGTPGALNAITDVVGLEVGYTTLISGDGPLEVGKGPVRTGVTAILPRGKGDEFGRPCAAGLYSHNGNGELTGSHWVKETGALNGPVMITNTHAIGPVHAGVVQWYVENKPELAAAWLLPVVAETFDGFLHDINGRHVKPEHAGEALNKAVGGTTPAEGSVGGGTGMNCYGFKGGCGTASRLVKFGPDKTYTVGSFLQCNFGSRPELNILGVPLGQILDAPNRIDGDWFQKDMERAKAAAEAMKKAKLPPGAGSVITVVATDAPLIPQQCEALARRVSMGLARTGTYGGHFSGDVFIAFSTAIQSEGALSSQFLYSEPDEAELQNLKFIPWGRMDPFFEAVVQCVEESVVNAIVANKVDFVGRDGHMSPHFPAALAVEKMKAWKVPVKE